MSEKLPPGNENIPPSPDWLEDPTEFHGEAAQEVRIEDHRRWALRHSGEDVMWGESTLAIKFAEMAKVGHSPGGYVLQIGSEVGPPPKNEYHIVTPSGDVVGGIVGVVSHKASPDISPDVRAVEVDDD